MFFKMAAFKRLLKEAYKTAGLIVGHTNYDNETDEEGIYLSGGYWIIWLSFETIPKEAKAAIIELVGDLPKQGEAFKAMKDYGNQYEIEQSNVYNLPEHYRQSQCEFTVSHLTVIQSDKVARFLQEPTTKHITAVNECFMGLIDPSAIDYDDGEMEPIGPVGDCPMAKFLYWGNERDYLMACIRTFDGTEESEFVKHLEGATLL